MEAHAQSVEDNLIDSLSFKLRPSASYVTDRRSVTFFHLAATNTQVTELKLSKSVETVTNGWIHQLSSCFTISRILPL